MALGESSCPAGLLLTWRDVEIVHIPPSTAGFWAHHDRSFSPCKLFLIPKKRLD
jgi:hypothetical protein